MRPTTEAPRQSQLPRPGRDHSGLTVERLGRVRTELALGTLGAVNDRLVAYGQEREPAFAGLALFSALLTAERGSCLATSAETALLSLGRAGLRAGNGRDQ